LKVSYKFLSLSLHGGFNARRLEEDTDALGTTRGDLLFAEWSKDPSLSTKGKKTRKASEDGSSEEMKVDSNEMKVDSEEHSGDQDDESVGSRGTAVSLKRKRA